VQRQPWIELNRTKLLDCRIFDVCSADRRSASGQEGTFYLIGAPDWAGIIPVVETERGREFVMIRQYRHGLSQYCLEFPGGLIDAGEDPVQAVARELFEETGYRAEMILPLGTLSPNPAMMTNRFHAFIAEGCTLEGKQSLDEHEDIEVVLIPEAEAIDLVGGEEMGHSLMVATLFFYQRYSGRSR